MLAIRNKIETLKVEKSDLEEEVRLLEASGAEKDLVIKKLQLRDSISQLEIKEYNTMDSILKEKIKRYDQITTNYNLLLLSTQEQLNAEVKKARREKFYKNLFKFGYPALGIIVGGILILKS